MPLEMPPHGDPLRKERRLARTYAFALVLIAGFAVATHTVIDLLIAANQQSARVIEIAGGQRMLSQRISLLAVELAHARATEERETLRRALSDAAETMHRRHVALLTGDAALGLPALSSESVDALYFAPPYDLDLAVRTYIGAAKGFAALPESMAGPDSAFLGFLIADPRARLYQGLEAVVQQSVVDSQLTVARMRLILWGLLAALLATIGGAGLFIFRPAFRRLLERTRDLYEMAKTDPLTGCHNRRFFFVLAEAERERVRRYGHACAVLMLDIDHFKSVNDTHGHYVGDRVIKAFAATCLDQLRRTDLFGRFGGEEFAAVLPETALGQAMVVAEKLRQAIEDLAVPLDDGRTLRLTASIGVSDVRKDDEGIHDAFNRADGNVYEAKAGGRNRVIGPAADAKRPPR